ncbi:MAG: ethanolamine ammonia-lyase subunit EutC [Bacteroidaceae bacterium]|nr:ethanolamine ammonia-lyase subunit EutC [Bacteroidaceae bacterium]
MVQDVSIKKEDILLEDCWNELKQFTAARIALGRTGGSLPTKEYLRFSLDHARARDAIHEPFNKEYVRGYLEEMGLDTIDVESAASDRQMFLLRPDLGRRLSNQSVAKLTRLDYKGADVCIVVGDGLSSKAVHKQAAPLIKNLLPYLKKIGLTVAPIVLATQSRVALGDDIAERMHCKCVIMLIGERPGLTSPDSLGMYMTYDTFLGRLESERNCVSNIRPEGLTYERAAFKIAWLVESAFSIGVSGTQLKDNSDDPKCYLTLRPMIECDK